MARLISADFEYDIWFDEFDWTEYSGRSSTRWGSGNNADGGDAPKQSDLRLAYNPGQDVVVCAIQYLMRRFRAEMGYRARILTAQWFFKQQTTATSGLFDIRLHAYLKAAGYPELDDMGQIYRDQSAALKWFSDAYAAQYGQDITTQAVAQGYFDLATASGDYYDALDITDYFTEQLLTGEDLWLELFQVTSSTSVFVGTSTVGKRPKIEVAYFFPLEMFPEHAVGGVADLSRLLNTDNAPIDLGALQAGEIGSPVQLHLVNFSAGVIDHAEVWDDYPLWSPPSPDAGNGGSGALAYVSVFEGCTSQRWELTFANATDFEVKATSYLNELESLHPQYDADASWEGDTSGDWSDPDGNVTIPTAGWSGTPNAGDIFTFRTRGNTTDPGWPADSNDQVEITRDDPASPGNPDNARWRPITAQRTLATAGVTIDATTKTFTVQRIDTTKWPVGDEAFIGDRDNLHRGNIKSVTATTVELENLTNDSTVYGIGAVVATSLPLRTIPAAKWAQLSAASGVSEPNADRLYIDNAATYGFTGSQTVFVQSLLDPTGTYEEGIVDNVQTDYLDLDTDLVNDYAAGAIVVERGSGEALFHVRPNTDPGTLEQLKEFRLNVLVL